MIRRTSKTLALVILASTCLAYAFTSAKDTPSRTLSQFTTQTLTSADGKQMNCHRRPGEGPVLVLVPGTWGDLKTFEPLIAELAAELPIVVIELCWQGGHVPPSLDLSIEQLADDVLWAVDELKLERFFIGGHSIGGMIAVEIAGRDVPGLLGTIPVEGWTHYTVVKTAFDGVVTGQLTPTQQALRQAGRTRGRAHLTEAQLQSIAKIWRRWNGYESLKRAQKPVLHIWGDRGRPHPDHEAIQIPDRPSIEIVWIAGASHALLIESPQAAAEVIVDFVRRNS